MSKQAISTPLAPAAIGPYSQAIRSGNLVFLSGQIPLDPETGHIVEGDAAVQTARVLQNLSAILEAAGSSLGQVLKTTVYLKDLADFAMMNEVYARFFGESRRPAPRWKWHACRATCQWKLTSSPKSRDEESELSVVSCQ